MPAGMSLVTTLPAPITALSPIRDARQHLHAHADPHIAADRDGFGIFQPGVALGCVHRVARRGEAAVRADEHMVAERDRRAVQDHQIMVGIKRLARADVEAVVHIKRRLDDNIVMAHGEQFAQQVQTLVRLCAAGQVVIQAQILCTGAFLQDLRVVVCIVEQPRRLPFPFRSLFASLFQGNTA